MRLTQSKKLNSVERPLRILARTTTATERAMPLISVKNRRRKRHHPKAYRARGDSLLTATESPRQVFQVLPNSQQHHPVLSRIVTTPSRPGTGPTVGHVEYGCGKPVNMMAAVSGTTAAMTTSHARRRARIKIQQQHLLR